MFLSPWLSAVNQNGINLRARHPSLRRPFGQLGGAGVESLERRTLLTAYVVDTLSDTVAVDGKVSLREAIQAANTNAAVNEASAGQGDAFDRISFAASLFTGGPATITLGGTQLAITDDLTISGPGASHLTISGSDRSRVFFVSTGTSAEISGLTITGGRSSSFSGWGGGIYNQGRLTVTASTISGNIAPNGGGIYCPGGEDYPAAPSYLKIVSSTVSGNTAYQHGGGIFNPSGGTLIVEDSTLTANTGQVAGGGIYGRAQAIMNSSITGNRADHGGGIAGGGPLTITNSTISGNEAGSGGGIEYYGGTLTITNSTISGNSARDTGGGIWNDGLLRISNSTISANSTHSPFKLPPGGGGGIYISYHGAATLLNVTIFGNRALGRATGGGILAIPNAVGFRMYNTLVAGNLSGAGVPDDISGKLAAAASSFNLIADINSAGGLVNGVNGNIVGVIPTTLLDTVLQDNGGPTKTHRLLPGSRAVDTGNDALALDPDGNPLTTDQRGSGFLRIQGLGVDIGAFEAIPERADLVAYHRGSWYVGTSDDSSFETTKWDAWGDVAWEAILHGDFNGDGRSDVLGLFQGQWYVGLSTGSSYTTTRWAQWANADWKNAAVGDLDGDGKDDIVARIGGRWWTALSTGSRFETPTVRVIWTDVDWSHVSLVDLDGDRKADLLGYDRGNWWVAPSTRSGAGVTTLWLWDRWADVAWDALGTFDGDGDGRQDLYGLYHGDWYVGRSLGTVFATGLRMRWAYIPWLDAVAGDFDNDGRDDLAARDAGRWWLSLSSPAGGTAGTAQWATWNNLDWRDTRVGDFDSDGRDDVASRVEGQWYVGLSTGSSLATSRWGGWADVEWQATAAVDADGPPPVADMAVSVTLPASRENEDVARLWFAADEDEELTAQLLAGSSAERSLHRGLSLSI